ncbi:Repressor of RNA polymerase III transcription MAF1 [Mycena kentingensis (nom. inval.)]|nr:Repressor of RNA polymerase III transcription MAF1 [Mycena kentingensis (nom. inval.)]
MKYLDCPALTSLAEALHHEGPECSVHTRIEAYATKQVKRDKKLWMGIDREAEPTPFGPIGEASSRKTWWLLVNALNVLFPDHEFAKVQPRDFNKEESGAAVLNALSTTLVAPHKAGMNAPRTYSSYPPSSSESFPSSEPTSSSPISSILRSPFAPPPDSLGHPPYPVFSYTPDIESDPHASDFSDDEDELGSPSDDEPSSDDEVFAFDDYDVDEVKPGRYKSGGGATPRDAVDSSVASYLPTSMRPRRGALLWSSHWFFLNRKLKRILFISVWARSRGLSLSRPWTSGETGELASERFLGWEGSAGAGARALGL